MCLYNCNNQNGDKCLRSVKLFELFVFELL